MQMGRKAVGGADIEQGFFPLALYYLFYPSL